MTPFEFIVLFLLGSVVGAISSFFGVGGGAFLVPALVAGAGLGWQSANALSLLQMTPMSCVAAWRRWLGREVDVRLAVTTLAGSVPGSILGTEIVDRLGKYGTFTVGGREIELLDVVLRIFFVGFLGFMASKMLRTEEKKATAPTAQAAHAASSATAAAGSMIDVPPARPPVPFGKAWLLGLEVGLTSGLLGIGGGFLFVPIAIERFGFPVVVAVGTSLFQMPVTAGSGAISYLWFQGVEIPWLWVIPILAGSITGVLAGIRLSRRFNNKQYRRLLGYMLLTVSVLFLVQGLQKILGAVPKP